MLNYIKSELYRALHSKEIHGTAIGLLAIILSMNLVLFLMKDVEHFRYGSASFSYSMLVSVPMMYCYVAADVAVMLYESDRRNGTMGNSIAHGISRMQLFAGKCIVCFTVSLILLAAALPVYIGSASLLHAQGPTTAQDMLLEIPAMSLIATGSLILAVVLLDCVRPGRCAIIEETGHLTKNGAPCKKRKTRFQGGAGWEIFSGHRIWDWCFY